MPRARSGRTELLRAESESYHAPGTCTFYGTANSNQMLMEAMGLHLPGAAFVNPGTPLRAALTRAATHRAAQITAQGNDYRPMGEIIDERAVVNAIATLVATGGSTNHTIHLVAMAAIAGIHIDWTDISDISRATPLLARVYPNGQADVNHFQAAGGTGFVIAQLLATGRMHGDVETVVGKGLAAYAPRAVDERRQAGLARRAEGKRRPQRAAPGQRSVRFRGRHPAADRQSRPLDHQGLGGEAAASRGARAGRDLRRPGQGAGRLQGRQAAPRRHRGGARAGPARQRHARVAQADAGARRAPGPRLQGRAGDRRPHVRRIGQSAGRDPRIA